MARERLSLYFNTDNEMEKLMWDYISKDGGYSKSSNVKKALEIMLEVDGVLPPVQLNRIVAESVLNGKVNVVAGTVASGLTMNMVHDEMKKDDDNIIQTSTDDDNIDIDDDIFA